MSDKIGIAGAGLSGAVIARELAEAGYRVEIFDRRGHVAGNCHTERDAETGVLTHRHGPHIFHTDDEEIWRYVQKFGEFMPFTNRVKAVTHKGVFSFPINLHTINQFFGTTCTPDEARKLIESKADRRIRSPSNFEEHALSLIGREMYTAFLYGYTVKQWGAEPTELPPSLLKRLPVRFVYDDNYYFHKHQGIPRRGYTPVVESMLGHENIEPTLGEAFPKNDRNEYAHVFWTGTLDGFFDHQLGRLAYRTLDFEEVRGTGDYQGCAVMNYCEAEVPYTRVVEHKHFAPWESVEKTLCFREYSRTCEGGDTPYYPIPLPAEEELARQYAKLARREHSVTFVGRLGTYRYLDMDRAVREALDTARRFVRRNGERGKHRA